MVLVDYSTSTDVIIDDDMEEIFETPNEGDKTDLPIDQILIKRSINYRDVGRKTGEKEFRNKFIHYISIHGVVDTKDIYEYNPEVVLLMIKNEKERELNAENIDMSAFKFFKNSKKFFYFISAILLPLVITSLFSNSISIYIWTTALLGSLALAIIAHTYELNIKDVS